MFFFYIFLLLLLLAFLLTHHLLLLLSLLWHLIFSSSASSASYSSSFSPFPRFSYVLSPTLHNYFFTFHRSFFKLLCFTIYTIFATPSHVHLHPQLPTPRSLYVPVEEGRLLDAPVNKWSLALPQQTCNPKYMYIYGAVVFCRSCWRLCSVFLILPESPIVPTSTTTTEALKGRTTPFSKWRFSHRRCNASANRLWDPVAFAFHTFCSFCCCCCCINYNSFTLPRR